MNKLVPLVATVPWVGESVSPPRALFVCASRFVAVAFFLRPGIRVWRWSISQTLIKYLWRQQKNPQQAEGAAVDNSPRGRRRPATFEPRDYEEML